MSDKSQNKFSKIVRVEITGNKMKVFLVVREPDIEEITSITPQDVDKIIDDAGVKFGINQDIIREIIHGKKWGERFVAAEGEPPVPGENAKLEFYFSTEKSHKPKIKENGHVDYKEISVVQSVEKDAVLVKIIAATFGPKGMDVLGNEIPAVAGSDIIPLQGKGTYRDSEDSSLIRAVTEGVVFYSARNNNLEVQHLYVVQDSVDYSTGNVNVKSSVKIKGDVKPGFSVTTPYNIDVGGVIEQAAISCEGTLKVKAGISGDDKQPIKVGGDVHSGYIYNQRLNSGGSVYVSTEIRNSILEIEDEVVVIKPNGIIIGGKITATNKVSAAFIGNEYNVSTEIEVGVNLKFKEAYFQKRKEKFELEKQMKDFKQKLEMFLQKAPKAAKKLRLNIFRNNWKELIKKYEILKKEFSDLEKAYYGAADPVVCVSKTVYPGTIIKIREATYEVKNELSHIVFKIVDKEIHNSNLE